MYINSLHLNTFCVSKYHSFYSQSSFLFLLLRYYDQSDEPIAPNGIKTIGFKLNSASFYTCAI